jgi:hypothetical protein
MYIIIQFHKRIEDELWEVVAERKQGLLAFVCCVLCTTAFPKNSFQVFFFATTVRPYLLAVQTRVSRWPFPGYHPTKHIVSQFNPLRRSHFFKHVLSYRIYISIYVCVCVCVCVYVCVCVCVGKYWVQGKCM